VQDYAPPMTSPPSSGDERETVSFPNCVSIFANTRSGRGKSRDLLHAIEARLRHRGYEVNICETSGAADLELRAREMTGNGTGLFFALGGDGTLHCLVNAAYGHNVLFGVIPAGGGNDFARALDLPLQPLAALDAALSGVPRAVDIVRARAKGGVTRLYLGGGGVGLDSAAAINANGIFKNWPGRWRYIASAIRAYAGYKPFRIRITFDSSAEEISRRHSTISSVLNTPTLGAGIKLAPDARIDDGVLDFVFLEKLGFGELLRALPRLALQGTLDLPQLIRRKTSKIRIEADPPAYFQGDGELIGLTPIEIEVIPKAVRFLAPRTADA
jgi:diacylglycerol kinase (ATP)